MIKHDCLHKEALEHVGTSWNMNMSLIKMQLNLRIPAVSAGFMTEIFQHFSCEGGV